MTSRRRQKGEPEVAAASTRVEEGNRHPRRDLTRKFRREKKEKKKKDEAESEEEEDEGPDAGLGALSSAVKGVRGFIQSGKSPKDTVSELRAVQTFCALPRNERGFILCAAAFEPAKLLEQIPLRASRRLRRPSGARAAARPPPGRRRTAPRRAPAQAPTSSRPS